jgi:hypothetical protein
VFGDFPINNDEAAKPLPCPTSTIGMPALSANWQYFSMLSKLIVCLTL